MNAEIPITRDEGPADIEAEQALLGAILINNDASIQVRSFLTSRHFAEPFHAEIYEIALALIDQGKRCNTVTIRQYLNPDGRVGDLTVAQYLARLTAEATSIVNAPDYAETVLEYWRRRRLIDAGLTMAELARLPSIKVGSEQIGVEFVDRVAEVMRSSSNPRKSRQYGDILLSAIQSAQDRRNDQTGLIKWFLPEVDEVVGGVRPGNLIGLMSDSGGGKTSFAVSQCRFAAECGVPSAFLSIEITEDEAALQMAAQRLRLSMSEVDEMDLLKGKSAELMDEIELGRKLRLAIEPFDEADLKSIGMTIASLKKRMGLRFAMIDHAKMIGLPGGKNDLFAERVNGLYRGLKAIAKASGVAIVILIQRNDDWKRRTNGKPIPGDAYGGGGVKQNLDAFFSLYRPEPLYRDKLGVEASEKERDRLVGLIERTKGYAWIVNHKRRRGAPLGERRIRFEAPFTLFTSDRETTPEAEQELPFG